MPFIEAGTFRHHVHADSDVEVMVHTFTWVSDAAGDAVLGDVELEGIIERVVCNKTRDRSATATHSVQLYDPLDADVLLSLIPTQKDNEQKQYSILAQQTPWHSFPVHVVGRLTLRINRSTAAEDAGVTKFYVRQPESFERWVN